MKKIKKFILAMMLMLFMPVLVYGCGETEITKIVVKNDTAATTWEIGKDYDYSKIVFVVEYSDGTTKDLTLDDVEVVSYIDTSTSGKKKLKIKYEGFEYEFEVNIQDDPDAPAEITGFEAPDFVTKHNSYKTLGTKPEEENAEGAFIIHNDTYYVGDDNPFKFLPNITAYKTAESTMPEKLNKYRSISKVELKEGSSYTDVTTQASIVEVDNVNSTFDFTQEAVGKTFKITVSPYYSDDEDHVVSFEFTVKDGYNVYDAHGLSVMDNNKYTARVWNPKKEEWGIPTNNYNPKGVYLHGDITLKTTDFPEKFFISAAEAGANDDEALGTLKQRTSLYTFQSARNAEEFEFCGNYFKIDASQIPVVRRDSYDESGDSSFYDDIETDEYAVGHASLFSFGGDNVQFSNEDAGEEEIQYVGPVKIKNTAFIGNAAQSDEADSSKLAGGLHMIISGSKKLTTENIITQKFLLSTNALGNWDGEGEQQDDYNSLTNDNSVVVRNSKYLDAFSMMFYVWGSKLDIYDSVLKGAGGPIFMAVHYGDEVNRHYPEVNIYDSEAESYVSGTEAWFGLYGASEVAQGLVQLAAAVKGNADGVEAAISEQTQTTFKYAKNSMFNEDNKFNFIGLIMEAEVGSSTKSECRGKINIYKTNPNYDAQNSESNKYLLKGSLNAWASDTENSQYNIYGRNENFSETYKVPLFQSCVNGQLSTMTSLIDEQGTLGIYGQSFTDCLTGSAAAQALGLNAQSVADFYSGDYLSVFVPGSRLARMATIVEYHRVDA